MSSSAMQQRRGPSGVQGNPRTDFGDPVLRRRDEASIEIQSESRDRLHHVLQEREEEEYYYVQSRPHSEGSDTATMHFTHDDRLDRVQDDEERYRDERSEDRRHQRNDLDSQRSRRHELSYDGTRHQQQQDHRFEEDQREHREYQRKYQRKTPTGGSTRSYQRERGDEMPVDYSPQDFRQSFAAIDAASRENVRVRQHGDTTIMTEHRDPYSFYWQLDQVRKAEEDPPRRPPPVDYVIDEEEDELEHYEPPQPRQDSVVLSPDSHDSGVNFENQYSRPHKIEEPPMKQLPVGWERHEDPSGFSYYWHVDSGTIQREPPKALQPPVSPPPVLQSRTPSPTPATFANRYTQADAEPPKQIVQMPSPQPIITEHAFKQTTTKRRIENRDESEENDGGFDDDDRKNHADNHSFGRFLNCFKNVILRNTIIDVFAATLALQKHVTMTTTTLATVLFYIRNSLMPVRFAVRSLGWTEISEEDLTAERSSRAVNRAIIDLAGGLTMDNVSKWGDGRELIMELDDQDLTLIDPDTMNVVHSEKIHQIRVWGVGRDNGSPFRSKGAEVRSNLVVP
ncbi:hypothetical protein L596_023796 [Steinernema carpocapsae]|uniref:WW domain-containing protein n=1 Tax=Steinernema carpocapsae TaxID=34508 RepID=A0A4U5MFI1_STECR|nr:hypothetical protein L596_023796 [Steinernema carpocapsae]